MRALARSVAGVVVLAAGTGLGGCASPDEGGRAEAPAADVVLPPAGAAFDYQIGEPYPPPPGTRVVTRDRGAQPAPGLYSICYVNAFQAQADELAWWEADHPDLLLRDGDGGGYVVDRDWDEVLLDISTAGGREALAGIVGGWIEGCAADGFDAVEPDNLDSYTRSEGRLTRADAAAFASLLAARAHETGLAVAQKNGTDLAAEAGAVGFDFAVAEECARWDECDAYADAYGPLVFVVEYTEDAFDAGCAAWPELSIVYRDRGVTAPGARTYAHAAC